jgi:hypothetical protein
MSGKQVLDVPELLMELGYDDGDGDGDDGARTWQLDEDTFVPKGDRSPE